MTFTRQSLNRPKTSISFAGTESMTEQQHKDSCDIHNIMHKYRETGVITHVNQYEGTYCDMSNSVDYHTAQNIIAEANSMFETVPAFIRADFDNDPSRFLDFMQNPENASKISEYGLSASHLPSNEEKPKPKGQPAKQAKNPPTEQPDPSDDS